MELHNINASTSFHSVLTNETHALGDGEVNLLFKGRRNINALTNLPSDEGVSSRPSTKDGLLQFC